MMHEGTLIGGRNEVGHVSNRGKVGGFRSEVHGDLTEHDGFSEDGIDKRGVAEKLVHSGEGEGEFDFKEQGSEWGFEDKIGDVEVLVSVPDCELRVKLPSEFTRKASKPFAHFPLIAESLPGGWVLRPRKRRRVWLEDCFQLPTVREGL